MNRNERLDLSRVQEALFDATIGHTLDYHPTIDSTMPRAMALAKDPATRSGTVVYAEEQQAGRGRRGRTWAAPYGSSLLFSVILKEPIAPIMAAQLSMIAGVAVTDAIWCVCPSLQARVRLKWPNDVVILEEKIDVANVVAESRQKPPIKKVGGILTQVDYRGEMPQIAVVGIGLNVNQQENGLPTVMAPMLSPTSLLLATNKPVDREQLFIQLCRVMEGMIPTSDIKETVIEAYRTRLATLGERVDVYSSLEAITPLIQGIAEDISESGDLLVRDAHNMLHTVSAGDVSLRSARMI